MISDEEKQEKPDYEKVQEILDKYGDVEEEVYFYTAGIMTKHKNSAIFNAERISGPMSPQKGRNSDEHNYDFKFSQTRTS